LYFQGMELVSRGTKAAARTLLTSNLQKLASELETTSARLNTITQDLKSLNSFARLSLYGWYGLVPVILGFSALACLLFNKLC